MISVVVTGDKAVAAKLGRMGDRVNAQVAREMRDTLIGMQSDVRTRKLSGDPLQQRTGNLSRSIHWDIKGESGVAVGRLYAGGMAAPYAGIHEYGGIIMIPEYQRMVRGRGHYTQLNAVTGKVRYAKGKLRKTIGYGGAATNYMSIVRAHQAVYRERSFLRTTLAEWRDHWIGAMQYVVRKAFGQAA